MLAWWLRPDMKPYKDRTEGRKRDEAFVQKAAAGHPKKHAAQLKEPSPVTPSHVLSWSPGPEFCILTLADLLCVFMEIKLLKLKN